MSAHTPGPWTVEPLGAPKSMPLIAGPSRGDKTPLVATAEFSRAGPVNHDQAVANAHLIAAEPELLAACIKTVEENAHLADGDDCTLIHLVRAIAKAKGQP